jgi:twitching motility protein PilT
MSDTVTVKKLLAFSLQRGASDLHLSAGLSPLIRLHGEMTRLDVPVLSGDELSTMLEEIMTPDQRDTFAQKLDLDFAMEVPGVGRYRANVFMQTRGPAAVFRTIPTQVPTLAEMKMPPILADLCLRERGLILVTGPTGSGKSTTLAAMVNHINENRRAHIITIEDPIEFIHTPKNCLINQREVGRHSHSFASALRGALREDPDVILVGELRDLETTQLAITAAETGHIVLGTLHTNSAPKTVDRIIDIFPAAQQAQIRSMFSESLVGIVSQVLLKKKDNSGRSCAHEILVAIPAVRNLIREEKTAQILSMIQTGTQHGMQSMDQCLKRLVMENVVHAEEAAGKASHPSVILGGKTDAAPAGSGPAGSSAQVKSVTHHTRPLPPAKAA